MQVRQRTQLVNALRDHLAKFDVIAPRGILHLRKLARTSETHENELPDLVRDLARNHLDLIADRACTAFDCFRELVGVEGADDAAFGAIHEALTHSAALSRFFRPSRKKQKLATARGRRLREAFEIGET